MSSYQGLTLRIVSTKEIIHLVSRLLCFSLNTRPSTFKRLQLRGSLVDALWTLRSRWPEISCLCLVLSKYLLQRCRKRHSSGHHPGRAVSRVKRSSSASLKPQRLTRNASDSCSGAGGKCAAGCPHLPESCCSGLGSSTVERPRKSVLRHLDQRTPVFTSERPRHRGDNWASNVQLSSLRSPERFSGLSKGTWQVIGRPKTRTVGFLVPYMVFF